MRSTGRTDVAIRNAAGFLGSGELDEGLWYSVKRRLLGPPMVNEELRHQRLSKPLALGVLSPDGISSSAYGSEEILIALLPLAGLAAFTIILPMTLVILVVMALVVLSYREVVMVYIRPGGSYVVARENFGPRVAQIAAVALLIDYVVTVAVQVTAGTAAVVSAVPALGPYTEPIVIGVILLMCYGNLRGIKEAGRIFALPTFLFSGAVILMIVVGLVREVLGDLPKYDPHTLPGTYPIGAGTAGIITFAMILTLLRAFANGGASLTGIEAVSDAVGAFRPPEGINARQVLVTEGVILGFLVAGISWLAHATLATPRNSGYPTVLAQEAQAVFGSSFLGHALFLLVQAATALILFTGGNTSFNGFPFLASYVAGDAFLPRWLLKRGHRLVFSNAIIGLTIVSIVLIIIRGPKVNNLVPLYAIGVFTAFSMAGFGMARYHKRNKEPGWRHKRAINPRGRRPDVGRRRDLRGGEVHRGRLAGGGALPDPVVRLHPAEPGVHAWRPRSSSGSGAAPSHRSSRTTPGGPCTCWWTASTWPRWRPCGTRAACGPTTLRAVHFVIDTEQADQLREEWMRGERDIVLDFVDAPDRRLTRAAAELVSREAAVPGTHVTAVLPRRSYSPLLGRLLHDRTADKIAAVVSQIPNAAATIVPFDVRSRLEVLHERQLERERAAAAGCPATARRPPERPPARCPRRRAPTPPRRTGRAGRGTRDGHAGRARGDPRHRRHGRGRGTAPGAGRAAPLAAAEPAAQAPSPAGRRSRPRPRPAGTARGRTTPPTTGRRPRRG